MEGRKERRKKGRKEGRTEGTDMYLIIFRIIFIMNNLRICRSNSRRCVVAEDRLDFYPDTPTGTMTQRSHAFITHWARD